MNKIKIIQKQIDKIEDLRQKERFNPDHKAWKSLTKSLLIKMFGDDSTQVKDFKKVKYSSNLWTGYETDQELHKIYTDGLDDAKALLESYIEELTILSESEAKSEPQAVHETIKGLSITYDGQIVKDKQYQSQDNFITLSDEAVYEIKFNNETGEITINNFLLSNPDWDSENFRFFEYVFANPNTKLEASVIDEKLKDRKKNYHQILSDLKFIGDVKKVFFKVSKTSVLFCNPVSKEQLGKIGIPKLTIVSKN